ncbi:MAG: glycerol-3-phosphate 1-O-acyltransferase PlsY [Gemmiger sp.]|uniref:glycerol-3-phosphate 1-O-acyltransferase PlsY n=1 Tax=Gemmiger sp. TaxID=2049027 RepID=UPI002E767045|nr:glycerol-3-phosphate 1-O-acyltransferase PlsY [Gemmiger sp.]MEE0801331.1 glycerol-3-phosphate 1-O-acyltransferase PlsY [Gemmiger sp.]
MLTQLFLASAFTALESYLLGSLLFGVLISKLVYHDDVRLHGSGNAGMTNVLRTYGKAAAVFTTVGDVGKSFLAVQIGRMIFDALVGSAGTDFQPMIQPICGAYLAAIFCTLGHSRPVFFGFRGGKGVLVGAGAALATEPMVCLMLILVFLVEFAVTRIVSLGSIIIAGLYPIVTLCYWVWRGIDLPSLVFITVCCVMMGIYVIWLHRSNIQRLRSGTEYRFGEKKKTGR